MSRSDINQVQGNFPSSHLRPELYYSCSCFVAFVVIFISFTFSREWEVSCFVIRWCVVGPTSHCSAVRTIDHVCFAVTDYLYCIANYSAPHTNTNCQAWVQTMSRSSSGHLKPSYISNLKVWTWSWLYNCNATTHHPAKFSEWDNTVSLQEVNHKHKGRFRDISEYAQRHGHAKIT